MEVVGKSETVSTDAVLGTNAIPQGTAAGVHGISKNGGQGVLGESVDGNGVKGTSVNSYGVRAHSDNIAGLRSSSKVARAIEGWGIKDDGIWGISTEANGVHGISENSGSGVVGESQKGRGVHGISDSWQGVLGQSNLNAGIVGESEKFHAVYGVSHDVNNGGVIGINIDHNNNEQGFGVIGRGNTGISGESKKGRGVQGISETGQGVYGHSNSQAGIVGESDQFVGVWGESKSAAQPGVFGKGKLAARFDGDVEVTGDIRLTNADFAEDFDVTERTEPGEVMVLTETGALEPSTKAYDKKVVGVISGAGNYKPGIILDKQNNSINRKPVAMMGKVYCKVNADISAIETGDMLTTSDIPGYAMKAVDPLKAFGAVIGKALTSLKQGKALIPILVVLQ